MQYDLEEIARLLKLEKWQWAKTMRGIPHEYIDRWKWMKMTDEEFINIFNAQRETGVHERWGTYNFPYLYVDGYKYWTMGAPLEETYILNRQKVFGEFDQLENPAIEVFPAELLKRSMNKIPEKLGGRVIEIGPGGGNLIKTGAIDAGNYVGYEPSQKNAQACKEFGFTVENKSFEEGYNKWKDVDGLFVALGGSINYVMKQYVELLADKTHFLVFYREGYVPTELSTMHHFLWTEEELKRTFPRSEVRHAGDWLFVYNF